ncbi:MAG: hypothetical protein JKY49_06970 [Cohaesibacteraceae bacterium]|nr:hypothetical protein [Cohaesibacteraceae bacterium]
MISPKLMTAAIVAIGLTSGSVAEASTFYKSGSYVSTSGYSTTTKSKSSRSVKPRYRNVCRWEKKKIYDSYTNSYYWKKIKVCKKVRL